MLEMTITRKETGPEGTFGLLESEALEMYVGELPWYKNTRNTSCIPIGRYKCKPHHSPKHGACFWLREVPGRTEILIHAANWMGDVTQGYKSNLAGCIAIGMRFVKDADANDQDMIQQSQLAMRKLIEYTEFKPFWLTIINDTGKRMVV